MTTFLPLRRRPMPVGLMLWTLLCLWSLPVAAFAASADRPAVPSSAPLSSPSGLTNVTDKDIFGVAQDLTPFAQQAGQDMLLLPLAEQAERDARSNQLFFSPWQQSRPSLSAKDFRGHILRKARGYCMDEPWSAQAWKSLTDNTNSVAYPAPRGPAIITRHADMRSMPTDKPLYLEPTTQAAVDFFDFFQHASLAWGTPVYVSHASADGKWLYVEYPLLSGWVRTTDVALVSRDAARSYAKGPFAVVVRDGSPLDSAGQGGGDTKAYIGAVFPYADAAREEIIVPLRNSDGTARMVRVRPPHGVVLPKPLPLTPAALTELGNQMLGQPYGWGGIDRNRDCSLAMRDLFLPFGIWLARNSRTQVEVKPFRKLATLSSAERKATLVREGVPFMTLLGFPGHVGLYVGVQDGEPIMLHTILGLRTSNAEQYFRHIIGKGILSTLEPGKEQPALQLRETLLERMRAMRHLH